MEGVASQVQLVGRSEGYSMMKELRLVLPSTASRRDYPNNKANHFIVKLPYQINLDGDGWKVALESISLPNKRLDLKSVFGYRTLF